MKRYLLLSQFARTPWALMPEVMDTMARILVRWAGGGEADAQTMAAVRADAQAREARREAANRAGNGSIVVLPMYGVVTQRGNMADDISGPGSMSTQRFTQAFRDAMADDTVGGILIDVDSPGGSVYGVSELADEIYQARGQKPVVAIANSLSASAAYWLATAADEFYITPGGEAGSIGVWMAHQDVSKYLAESGIATTLISAGKFKTEGNQYAPLTDEARGFMQKRVDEYYGMFSRAVARQRGVPIGQVREGMGQGRVLGPQDAKDQNMVDDIAPFDEVVKRLAKTIRGGSSVKSRSAAANRIAVAEIEEQAVVHVLAAEDAQQYQTNAALPAVEPMAADVPPAKPNSRAQQSRRDLELLSA